MSELYLMVTIADRKRLKDFIDVYESVPIAVSYVSLARGTADHSALDLLGLESTEKAFILAVVTDEAWHKVSKLFRSKLKIDIPGTGISFIIPLSSIGGRRELLYLTHGQNYVKGSESTLKATERELIIAISNQGYSNDVMDCARAAGAGGGTVIHAKGTGTEHAERFLGISLASEKDIIFIVAPTAKKNDIMSAIVRGAGMESKAKTIVFSLPVTDTAGLRLIEEQTETV